jgi:hypothetical protein
MLHLSLREASPQSFTASTNPVAGHLVRLCA